MQVDRYNHLLFPRDANTPGSGTSNAATGDKEPSGAAAAGVAARARPQQPGWGVQPDARVANRTESVVLKIQWPDGSTAKPKDIALYTPGGRMPVTGNARANSKAAAPAIEQQPLAVDREAAAGASAQVEPAAQAQPDFVALAVSALREYRDDRERQQAASPAAPSASTAPEAQWSALKGLQQFAAKLNVFA